MPMPFLKAVLTDKGIELLNRSGAGEGAIHFTKMSIGNGAYSLGDKSKESLKKRIGLKSLKNDYRISSIKKQQGNAIRITAIISNQDPESKQAAITEGFNINEVGLFAKLENDKDDILYSIAVTSGESGDFIPAFTGSEATQIVQSYVVVVSNEANISITQSNERYAIKADVDQEIGELRESNTRDLKSMKSAIEGTTTSKISESERKLNETINTKETALNKKIKHEAEQRFKDLYGLADKTVTFSAGRSTVTSVSGDIKVTTTISKSEENTTLKTIVEKGEQEQEGYEKYTKTTTMTKLSDGRTQVTVNYIKNV